LYDAYRAVLASTVPATLTTTLAGSGDVPDPDTGLVYLGDGRFYDPALGHPLQPNPVGGPPALPQALNRYAATSWGAPGVSQSVSTLPALAFATSIAKNTASNALAYAVGETLGNTYAYDIITVSRMGRLRFLANKALLKRAGVYDLFSRVPNTGGRGKSAEYVSQLVRELGEDVFEVAEGTNAGRAINLARLRALGTGRWGIRYGLDGPFEVSGYSSARMAGYGFFSAFWRDTAWNAAIAIAIETPFFIDNVWGDPYLTRTQKEWQAGITLFGIVGTAGSAAAIGAAFGNMPGAIVGFVVGLGYEYVIMPFLIRPAVYQFTGVDPYDRTRRLAPLNFP
jgi:hypothetical protein